MLWATKCDPQKIYFNLKRVQKLFHAHPIRKWVSLKFRASPFYHLHSLTRFWRPFQLTEWWVLFIAVYQTAGDLLNIDSIKIAPFARISKSHSTEKTPFFFNCENNEFASTETNKPFNFSQTKIYQKQWLSCQWRMKQLRFPIFFFCRKMALYG